MIRQFRTLALAGLLTLLTMLLSACGGGDSSADLVPGAPHPPAVVTGPNSFLLFPNPIKLDDGSFQTTAVGYAQAYYEAIDPTNAKDTLAKWMTVNGFGTAAGPLGEVSATVGDVRDLGYGRRITGRQNLDGTIAIMVENYQVDTGIDYGFSSFNLDAAVARNLRWHIGVSAVEYSPGPGGTVNFVKFYMFDPTTGARMLSADLDGRGVKAMPAICSNCHGGRADPLTPVDPASGKPLFALVANSRSQARGDLTGRLQILKVDEFAYSATTGYTRADLEGNLKILNRMVLCTYSLVGAAAGAEDNCRPSAALSPNEWQGTAAAAVLKAAYGGDGLPSGTYSDTLVPATWSAAGQTALYNNVVKPACLTCHLVRGTANQSNISFTTYADFLSHSDRTKAHVYDRGNMPLALIVWGDFWDSGLGATLASWLESLGLGYVVRDGAGTVLKPGRPVADPGPDRVVMQGTSPLSASNSLYSSRYTWTLTSNPGGAASLTNTTTATPTFNATADGTYQVQLVTSDGVTSSSPATLTIVVDNTLPIAPSAIRYNDPTAVTDIKRVLQAGLGSCTGCHVPPGTGGFRPPILHSDVDRNGDGVVDATDAQWHHAELKGRINFTDIAASPLLRKPAGHHHAGGQRPGYADTTLPGTRGAGGRSDYDLILNWILAGAPY